MISDTELIKTALKNTTPEDLAKELSVGKTQISNYKKGRNSIPSDKLRKLLDILNLTFADKTIVENSEVFSAPFLHAMPAGEPKHFFTDLPEKRIILPMNLFGELRHKKIITFQVKGDSMEPTLPDESFIIAEKITDIPFREGEIGLFYIILTREWTIKRSYSGRKKNEIILIPDNRRGYRSMTFLRTEIKEVARIHSVIQTNINRLREQKGRKNES